MSAKHYLVALTFLTSALAQAASVSSITAREHTITVGDTADGVFKVLKEKDMVNQDVEKTEDGLRLTCGHTIKSDTKQ